MQLLLRQGFIGAVLLIAACAPKPKPRTSIPTPPPRAAVCPEGMAEIPPGTLHSKDVPEVRGFCLDRTEVTAAAYARCVGAGRCSADKLTCDPAGNSGAVGREQHPINCVDGKQAEAFCQGEGKRLPTEAEWIWAAQGGPSGTPFPWGTAPLGDQLCWSGKAKRSGTCPVGSFPAGDSPAGVHDLLGNVAEITTDETGKPRVSRGMSWDDFDPKTIGLRMPAWGRGPMVGFRCAKSL